VAATAIAAELQAYADDPGLANAAGQEPWDWAAMARYARLIA
jgi:hypothetical protein